MIRSGSIYEEKSFLGNDIGEDDLGIATMAAIAVECARTPGLTSIWSKNLGRYVCSKDPEFERAAREESTGSSPDHVPINSAFKLVFLASLGGTALFTAICVTTTLLAGREPPPLTVELVRWLGDLAKLGFGAMTGLLGGQSLRR
ncbi:MAG: hypothetical protein JO276_15560 [Sphingomonadaceae bacterium]|nr:hypothetical protein [Sphingomonadaceae bacterium]